MAQYHVYHSKIRKGKSPGGSTRFAAYLERRDPERATQHMRYLARDGHEKEDLVAAGAGGLPRWAEESAVLSWWAEKSAGLFWWAADRYERKNAVLARHYQIALPQELSPQGRLALAEDIRAVFFERYPHTWAVHCPPVREGAGDNPHLHVMLSERRDDGREGGPKAWFRRANPDGTGGIKKDAFWREKSTLQGVRYETAILINAALERDGYAVAVSHDRLVGQGHARKGLHYEQHIKSPAMAHIQAQQARLREQGVQDIEQQMNVLNWETQKLQEGIKDISREAIVDHCRDRFWLHDKSEAREQEREASVERAIEREWACTGRERDEAQERERVPEHDRSSPNRSTHRLVPEDDLHPHGHAEVRFSEEQRWTLSR